MANSPAPGRVPGLADLAPQCTTRCYAMSGACRITASPPSPRRARRARRLPGRRRHRRASSPMRRAPAASSSSRSPLSASSRTATTRSSPPATSRATCSRGARRARLHHIGIDIHLSLYDGLDLTIVPPEEADIVSCTGLRDDDHETPADYEAELAAPRRGACRSSAPIPTSSSSAATSSSIAPARWPSAMRNWAARPSRRQAACADLRPGTGARRRAPRRHGARAGARHRRRRADRSRRRVPPRPRRAVRHRRHPFRPFRPAARSGCGGGASLPRGRAPRRTRLHAGARMVTGGDCAQPPRLRRPPAEPPRPGCRDPCRAGGIHPPSRRRPIDADGGTAHPARRPAGGAQGRGAGDRQFRRHASRPSSVLPSAARREADARGLPALMLIFEPHPRSVLEPGEPLFRSTPLAQGSGSPPPSGLTASSSRGSIPPSRR